MVLTGPTQPEMFCDSNLEFLPIGAANTPHPFESGCAGPAVLSSRLGNRVGKAPARSGGKGSLGWAKWVFTSGWLEAKQPQPVTGRNGVGSIMEVEFS